MELIRNPEDLRPGDIMFGPIGGLTGLGVGLGQLMLGEVFRLGQRSLRHVAIVTKGAAPQFPYQTRTPKLVQAMPTGAEEVDFDRSKHWTDRHAYVRVPEGYTGQREDAARVARCFVEDQVAYSFLSYPALAAWRWGLRAERLERWINRRRAPRMTQLQGVPAHVQLPAEAICSVLVDQAWSLTGYRLMEGVARQAVTPGALANQLLDRTGAVWGLPREGEKLPARSWEV